MQMLIKKLVPEATLPTFAHTTDAGMDLYALEDTVILGGERGLIKTGIAVAIPTGYVGLLWDKSGLSNKQGLKTLGGVIDAGYRGEILVGLLNTSDNDVTFFAGQKIVQMLVQKVEHPQLVEVAELAETDRGAGAFGSTGK